MCTIILFYRIFAAYPLVIASNRDEVYGRKSVPPRRLSRNPVILGGQDLEAGGTWMGVNEKGLWAGMANRRSPLPNDTKRRSRGMLCMDLLRNPACEEAVSLLGLLNKKTLPDPDALAEALGDHGESASDAVCVHEQAGGTRSSTVLFLHSQVEKSRYFFAEGAPCRTPFSDYSDLLRQAE